ncbi:MAG: N-6 DNA methylase [Firmicutes bacterium]|nr:N-6 DNA methylase [Bacillota bacterium]
MDLAIRGIPNENILLGDTFTNDPRRLHHHQPALQYEGVGRRQGGRRRLPQIWAPPNSNANYMWTQHFIHHLAPKNGRAGFVMANGSLSVAGWRARTGREFFEGEKW